MAGAEKRWTLSLPIDQYNASPGDFLAFMRDRARVERMKSLMEKLIGPVQSISPLKD